MSARNQEQIDTGPAPNWGVIWLHGLGADGHDFVPIVPELVTKHWPAIRFVFPHAPVRAVTINGGARMRAWYDIKTLDRAALGEAPGIRESIALVAEIVGDLGTHGIAPEHIFVIGFSQGGALALSAALRFPQKLAGVVALSCYLPLAESLATEADPANANLPVFMAHGVQDPVVPMALGTLSAEILRARNLTVDWHQYPMPHSVCAEEIRDLREWMGARLGL
jgi:phospholipase/carboxylesterase